MRISHVSIANFLSFGPEPNNFQMNLSSDNLTVLVGPNGAGKSNVFRAVKVVLDALSWNPKHYGSVDVQNLFFKQSKESKQLVIRLGILLDTAVDHEIVSCFFKCALLNPEDQLFQGVGLSDGSNASGINLIADRALAYERLVDDCFDNTSIDGFLRGVIEVTAHTSEPYIRDAKYITNDGTLEINLMASAGEIRVVNSKNHQKHMSLVNAIIEGMNENDKIKLKKYLSGESENIASMPTFCANMVQETLSRTMTVANAKIGNVYSPLPTYIERLYNLLGNRNEPNQNVNFAHIMRFLISHGIGLLNNWFPSESSVINSDYHPLQSLKDGDLALHLFKLKNGLQNDRDIFKSIVNLFSRISGSRLDVVVHSYSNQNKSGQKENVQSANIIIDEDIPLSLAGSGRGQLALLIAAMHLQYGVLLLDEPDTFLHPSVQAFLIDLWKNKSVQSIIITHSPYMVPVGGLAQVRRIYRNHNLGSSMVSPSFSREEITELGIQRQIKRADETMFLFAKCVVLVEGYDEQIALPIWFDKWLEIQGKPSSEALGVRFHAAFGKTGIMPLVRIAEAYGIEWIALFDADIMSSNSDNRDDNKKIIQQLIDAKQVDDGVLQLGKIESIEKFPIGPSQSIFLRGTELNDNWETMDIYKEYKARLVYQIGKGPMISKYMAEEASTPSEFDVFFKRICELVESGQLFGGESSAN